MTHKLGDTVYIRHLNTRWQNGEKFTWTENLLRYHGKKGQVARADPADSSCLVDFEDNHSYWFPTSVFGTTIEVLLKCEDFTETVEMSKELYNLIMSKKPISITSYE